MYSTQAGHLKTIDITPLRRLKGHLNLARTVGLIFGTFILFGALGAPWFLLLAALMFWGTARVWYASVAGAAVQSSLALLATGVFLYALLTPVGTPGFPGDPELQGMAERASRTFQLVFGGLSLGAALVFLAGLRAAVKLRRVLPDHPLYASGLLKRMRRYWSGSSTPRRRFLAVTYMGLAVVFGIVAASPGLVGLARFVLGPEASAVARKVDGMILEGPMWLFLIVLAGMFTSIWGALVCAGRAKRLATPGVAEARSMDRRNPVLLLRSFRDDVTPLQRTTDSHAWGRTVLYRGYWTLEETLETALRSVGPVVAIGRPGEPLPPAGAAREYVSNQKWRNRVKHYIGESELIVAIIGKGEGLNFEYRSLVQAGALHKLILVFPPVSGRELRERWLRFARVSCPGLAEKALPDLDRTLAALVADGDQPTFVTCKWREDEDCYRIALGRCLQELK